MVRPRSNQSIHSIDDHPICLSDLVSSWRTQNPSISSFNLNSLIPMLYLFLVGWYRHIYVYMFCDDEFLIFFFSFRLVTVFIFTCPTIPSTIYIHMSITPKNKNKKKTLDRFDDLCVFDFKMTLSWFYFCFYHCVRALCVCPNRICEMWVCLVLVLSLNWVKTPGKHEKRYQTSINSKSIHIWNSMEIYSSFSAFFRGYTFIYRLWFDLG